MLTRRLSTSELVALCRALRYQLAAGVGLVKVMRQQAERGPGGVRWLAARVLPELEQGTALGDAFERVGDAMPPLFQSMVRLADETGHLPEVLGELEQYYQLQLSLRRQFLAQSILPVIQFAFAVLVIAGLIFILGVLAGTGKPLLTFFGLGGAPGALAFLGVVAAVLGGVALLWFAVARGSGGHAAVQRMLLRLPVLGPCLEALALSRFALALGLTLDSGLAIAKGLRLSLRATGSAVFDDAADGVARVLKAGGTLTEALTQSGLFSEEFLAIVGTAEEVGSVPEVMRQQAAYYHEEAARRMKALTWAASMGLWLLYAGFMIWMIFKIAGVYLNALGI